MARRSEFRGSEPRYDEERVERPKHCTPETGRVRYHEHRGATARLLLERAIRDVGGFGVARFDQLGVSLDELVPGARELTDVFIQYRGAVGDALLSIVREGPAANEPRVRAAAIAYLGELGFAEATDVLGGLATSPAETHSTRGVAVEALGRLGGKAAREALGRALAEPDPVVRRRAARALGRIGDRSDLPALLDAAREDEYAEVRIESVRAAVAIQPSLQDELDEKSCPPPGRRSSGARRELLEEPSIHRSIGRHVGAAPQSIGAGARGEEASDKHDGAEGGRDLVGERLIHELEETASRSRSRAIGYEVVRAGHGCAVRLRLHGSSLPPELGACGRPAMRRSDREAWIDLDSDEPLAPGRPVPLTGVDATRCPTWVPGGAGMPKLVGVEPVGPAVWACRSFALRVRFEAPSNDPVVFLRLRVRLPLDGWREILREVGEEECSRGEVIVSGYESAIAGPVDAYAEVYSDSGAVDRESARFSALPTNPISMYVVPQTTGTNGEGPAHYNSGEDRFYCYARCVVTNGYPHAVTVGPNVTCRVTDGGSHVATFGFTIGTVSVPANSTRTLSIYTRHGSASDVYDVFRDFGDVRMDFTIGTSEEDVTGWHVWAAMAQIDLALNFVGDIDWTTRATFQSVSENEASAIYEQQSLYVGETRRFLLPRDHADWARYRDIRMDDNKAEDCTAGSDEADGMRDDWSSPTSWLDVWIVESFSGPTCAASVGGFSPVNGPTGKGGSDSGVVIQLAGIDMTTTGGRDLMGIVIAHEVAHFLGLNHIDDDDNFMNASTDGTNTEIGHNQYRDMADHGFVERFVP